MARRMGRCGSGNGAMAYSVAQAAKAIGKSKNTVLRAISSGRISAVRDATTGAFQIEPSELHRVFAPATTAPHGVGHDVPDGAIRVAVLQAQLSEKEALIAVLERANEDLRRQRDAEAEERRRLTAVLADQRTAQPTSPAPTRRAWWPWGRKLGIAAAVWFAACGLALAEDGNELLEDCLEAFGQNFCLGYITGVAEATGFVDAGVCL